MIQIFLFFYVFFSYGGASLVKDIPYPFYVSYSQVDHEVMSIDSGLAALELRLQMIRKARESIEVEYFCYNTDLTSKIFTQELVKAAQRGVKVRVLIDTAVNVFVFDEYYAKEMKAKGIEVKYFNNASLFNFSKVIYRNHRKLLATDGREAITGGRNMGDEYFGLSDGLNYNDRDIFVKGPVVTEMVKSFDKYYSHEMAEFPEDPGHSEEKKSLARAFFSLSEKEEETRKKIEKAGKSELTKIKSHKCPVTTFSTDAPGGGFKGFFSQAFADKYRFLRKVLIHKISQADKGVLFSTPYFLTNSDSEKLIENLLRKKVTISIYTNSLAGSDAAYMSANMYLTMDKWVEKGVIFYLHTGEWPEENLLIDSRKENQKWSEHSKTHIYESQDFSEVMIGTFNMHNRSSYYDSEMALFCKGNDDFAREVKSSILRRANKGIIIKKNTIAFDGEGNPASVYGPAEDKVQEMQLMSLPAWLLKFLL